MQLATVPGPAADARKETDLVVQIPSVIEIFDLPILPVATTGFSRVGEIATESLRKGNLAKGFGTLGKEGKISGETHRATSL